MVVGGAVALELLLGLLAEVGAVDEEEHAAGAAELDQAIDGGDRGAGLAAAGRHLDQGAGAVAPEGLLEVGDGVELVLVQALVLDARQRLEARPERRRLGVVGGGVEPAPSACRR